MKERPRMPGKTNIPVMPKTFCTPKINNSL